LQLHEALSDFIAEDHAFQLFILSSQFEKLLLLIFVIGEDPAAQHAVLGDGKDVR
jgi:hypothetical protein